MLAEAGRHAEVQVGGWVGGAGCFPRRRSSSPSPPPAPHPHAPEPLGVPNDVRRAAVADCHARIMHHTSRACLHPALRSRETKQPHNQAANCTLIMRCCASGAHPLAGSKAWQRHAMRRPVLCPRTTSLQQRAYDHGCASQHGTGPPRFPLLPHSLRCRSRTVAAAARPACLLSCGPWCAPECGWSSSQLGWTSSQLPSCLASWLAI